MKLRLQKVLIMFHTFPIGSVVGISHDGNIFHKRNRNERGNAIYRRTTSVWQSKRFLEQSKLNLPTFASTNCTGKLVKASTKSSVKFDKTLFQRLLVVSQTRDINMEHVLSFELNYVTLSITHASGEMRKTCKSKLLQEFEVIEKVIALEISAHNTCVIIDLLVTVQRVSTINCVNFGDTCIKLYEKEMFIEYPWTNYPKLFNTFTTDFQTIPFDFTQ